MQVYKGLNIESGEVVAVKQVQLNVINTDQLDSARPCCCCIVALLHFLLVPQVFAGIMGEIALLKRLKSSRITRYMDSIKTKVFCRRCCALRHVPYFGIDDCLFQDSLFIVLEYVEGGSLADMRKRYGPWPERLVAKYTAQLLEGLDFLHQQVFSVESSRDI